MFIIRLFVAATVCLLPTQHVIAQSSNKAKLIGGTLIENVRDAANLSTGVITGIVVKGNVKQGEPRVQAYIPKDWGGKTFCVKVTSADGLYEADNAYSVDADWPGQVANIPFPSKHVELLDGLPSDNLSVLVSKNQCGEDRGPVAIAFWNDDNPSQKGNAEVFVNSFAADQVFMIILQDPSMTQMACRPVVAPFSAAFDTVCPLKMGLIPKNGDATLNIFSVRGPELDPPVEVGLQAASAR